MKVCKKCGENKSDDEFYKEARTSSGLTARCKECMKTDASQSYWKNPERAKKRIREAYDYAQRRERTLREKYNLTPDDYERMFVEQEGKCKICGTEDSGHNMTKHLVVDHDEDTGKVRGLLCSSCNLMIGKAHHDTDVLQNAITYLQEAA